MNAKPHHQLKVGMVALFFSFALSVPSFAQDQKQIPAGQKTKVEGIIVKRDADNLTLRDSQGSTILVAVTNNTEVKEKKNNPFRRARNYAKTQLLRGLSIQVEGRGNNTGALVADEIKFTVDNLRVASSLETQVVPVENRLGRAEIRLGQSEQNAQRLSGQVEELTTLSGAAREGVKTAQQTADSALGAANTANTGVRTANDRISATNNRIGRLDDYDVKRSAMVHFKVGSAMLSKEAQADLDKIAEQAQNDKGFLIEVTGFASADGSEAANRRLSQRRADAVIRYLAENHRIPLRRFITPFGYGEKQPVADNNSRDGRSQNRRVEVKILVNQGIIQSATAGSTR